MPSFASRRLRVVLGIAMAAAILAVAGSWLRGGSLAGVREVTVSGIDGRQAPQIRDALTVAALDMSTLDIDEQALRDAVSDYPAVRRVRASADFPHRLRIVVQAHRPVAALQAGGTLVAVAANGLLLRGNATKGLPVVGVKRLPQTRAEPATLGAIRLIAAAPPALRRRLTRVFRAERGLAATVESGPKLYFGSGERLAAKWSAAAQVLAHAGAQGASYVDLRVPERAVAGGFQPRPDKVSLSTLG